MSINHCEFFTNHGNRQSLKTTKARNKVMKRIDLNAISPSLKFALVTSVLLERDKVELDVVLNA